MTIDARELDCYPCDLPRDVVKSKAPKARSSLQRHAPKQSLDLQVFDGAILVPFVALGNKFQCHDLLSGFAESRTALLLKLNEPVAAVELVTVKRPLHHWEARSRVGTV